MRSSISADAILRIVKNVPPDFSIEVLECVDSTNSYLKKHSAEYKNRNHLLIALSQTSGRGRMGRSFKSPISGIYMSFLLHPDIPASEALYLTTMAAVAVSEAIEDVCGLKTAIKWVNDIYSDRKKVCGILTEASINNEDFSLNYAIVGIGINVEEPAGGFDKEISSIAGALYKTGKAPQDTYNMLTAAVIERFFRYYSCSDRKVFLSEYKRRSCIIGREICIMENIFEPDNLISATALDIDDECHLIVRLNDGTIKKLSSGDVSIRTEDMLKNMK